PHQPYSTPATSPPTPSRNSDGITTRSGTVILKTGTSKTLGPKSAGVQKATTKKERAKPAKEEKEEKEKEKQTDNVRQLDGPISVITKDSQIPICDIETYVNRTVEERHRETENCVKTPGRIKRPMN